MTNLAEEKAEQQRWMQILRRPDPVYDTLLEHEFETPEQYRARNAQNLGAMLRFASREVPHYREAFRRANLDTTERDPTNVLEALPVLSKLDVQDAGRALVAKNLPPGDLQSHWWESSGTTGRPTRVLHSMRSVRMYKLLAQRGCRWHRLDPSGTFADMRIPRLLPRRADGSLLEAGETARLGQWRDFEDFATGPYVGISIMTPMEDRIAWLRRERPDYLMAYSETLELLALATGDDRPVDSLKAVMAISEQLTPSMRSYVERRFGTPVYQVYGLTEFGLAAVRCDAGRYHVHREHCLVEIVDEQGRACAPGETGRIVVTGLSNFAMPLIRYDTGDLAEAAGGNCSCGRTLPSFGDIVGRYGRAAYLPAGTMGPVLALREAIETMPTDMMRGLREFQLHQYADRRMELRLVARSPLPEAFFTRIRAEWAKATGGGGPELSFRSVDQIPKSGGKSEVFTSDFMPARDGKPLTTRASGAGGSETNSRRARSMTSSALDEAFLTVRAGTRRSEADIYRLYAEMRRAAPLWRSPWGDVYLSSYDLVDQALASRAMSHALRPGLPNSDRRDTEASPIADWLMFMDGADHTLMRRAFLGPFAAGDGSLVRRVGAIVDEQMSAVDLDCPIDAVAQFTRAIPERVVGGMMGVPSADLPLLRAWSQDIRTALDTGMASIAAGNDDAATDLTDYFADALGRRQPGSAIVGDFNVSELIDAVGVRAAAANLAFIAFAGYETTVHLLGSMLLHLSMRPDVWDAVCKTPGLAPVVVSEALRLESPVQKACRWALTDIEFSGGHRLHKGEYAVLLLGAANRDPARFPKPDHINLSQAQNVHLGFGKGLHSCLGRGLAMIEGTAVLRWLVEHVRTIPATGYDLDWIPNSSFRGLQRLPITLQR